MKAFFLHTYDRLILARPITSLLITLAVVGFFVIQIPHFKLDASGDSLVLENDQDLRYFRQITERYGSNNILIIAYSPKDDLFSPAVLTDLKEFRDELKKLDGVHSVTTILDVPLFYSSDIRLEDLAEEEKIKTLENSSLDRDKALAEFNDNPLYRGRLLSSDGKTSAILLSLEVNQKYQDLLTRRYELREKRYDTLLSPAETDELQTVSKEYRALLAELINNQKSLVADVRDVMDRHRDQASIFLGGLPMIVADMIGFIKKDLLIFGLGVILFLIITLTLIFRELRWVLLSVFCCLIAVLTMMGYLGAVDWRITVISSNFISLMLILTMSLTIHLIQRYLEVHAQSPEKDQRSLVLETVRTIWLPCLYTTLTTIVAFISLVVSDIRPVIDFGMMMVIGLIVAFTLAFVLFPATVALLKKSPTNAAKNSSNPFTHVFARLTERYGVLIILISLALTVFSGVGINMLRVDNRFIDYFRQDTEIYQGMSLIDKKLGGTTPLDIIIDFKPVMDAPEDDEYEEDDPFADEFEDELISYWFADLYTVEQIEKVHVFLESLSETGEVLSLATTGQVAAHINNDVPLDNYELALMYKKSPPTIKNLLLKPYISEDITQARFAMRIVESDKNMSRTALLDRIRIALVNQMGFTEDQIHFTNMYVLYNNMLLSLFHSQILTIGMVFLGIMLMFTLLFRSFYLAAIAVFPNALPVFMVLGTMGWLGISLDMMTITIASITIGIAVDNTIHYIHRFQREFPKDRNYIATMYRCHGSIGKAMYYTSITITIGFSILVFSSFVPTIYFGLFTGLAMIVALLTDLMLLPKLLILFKPLGPEESL